MQKKLRKFVWKIIRTCFNSKELGEITKFSAFIARFWEMVMAHRVGLACHKLFMQVALYRIGRAWFRSVQKVYGQRSKRPSI